MSADTDTTPVWDLEVRARKMTAVTIAVVVLLLVGHIVAALVLRSGGDTGVYLRIWDQLAMIAIGVVVSSFVLVFTRPRFRVGASGVALRNMFGEKHFDWSQVRGVSFPESSPWARLELPHDEYLAIVALQARDGERTADALDRFRELHRRYGQRVGDAD